MPFSQVSRDHLARTLTGNQISLPHQAGSHQDYDGGPFFEIRCDSLRVPPRRDPGRGRESNCGVCRERSLSSTTRLSLTEQDAASVETCFNDPERAHCVSRSNRNISNFDIGIERASSREMTRTIYIKLSGPRADSRARSASPPSAFKGEQPPAGDYRPLPEQISIWAFPHRLRRSSRVEWWARVAIGQSPEAFIIDKARAETGQEPVHLDNIDLRRRMPEKHVSRRFSRHCIDGLHRLYPGFATTLRTWLTLSLRPTGNKAGLSASLVNETPKGS